jgi:hypothetical protein
VSNIEPGSLVRLIRIPDGIDDLPEETQAVFRHCLGKTFRVVSVDQGLLVLDVGAEIDRRFGGFGSDIRVEPGCVRRSSSGRD